MSDEPEIAEAEQVAEPTNVPAVRKKAELVADESKGYILPRTMEEAYRFAVAVVDGRLAPDSYGNNPTQVMLGIAAAMEAGLPPLYGLRNIAIINGRPTIWGDAAMTLVQAKNLIEKQITREVGEGFDVDGSSVDKWPDSYGFTVSLWRRGQTEPYVGTFTVGDARRANLWLNHKKKPWIEHPKRMLMIRARTFPLRDGFADALAGLAIREEVEDTFGEAAPIDTDFLSDEPAELEAAA